MKSFLFLSLSLCLIVFYNPVFADSDDHQTVVIPPAVNNIYNTTTIKKQKDYGAKGIIVGAILGSIVAHYGFHCNWSWKCKQDKISISVLEK